MSQHGERLVLPLTRDKRWYDVNVPIAERLYDEHLKQLSDEGEIDG